MSTKRTQLPFSQSVPLFTIKTFKDGKTTTKVLGVSSSIESNEIYMPSEKGFGSIVFQSVSAGGTTSITVKIQYRVRETDTWTDAVNIDSISHTGTKAYAWRLDAKLGASWIPNHPFRIVFTETGGSSGAIIQGDISA